MTFIIAKTNLIRQKTCPSGREGGSVIFPYALVATCKKHSLKPMVRIENNLAEMVTLDDLTIVDLGVNNQIKQIKALT